jgi:hypothetical protein
MNIKSQPKKLIASKTKDIREHLKYLDALINQNSDDLFHRMDEIINARQVLRIELFKLSKRSTIGEKDEQAN